MQTTEVWTVEESRLQDQEAQAMGVNILWLMETAGSRAAYYLLPELTGPGLVIVGKGHNGGDALVLARHLARYREILVIMPLGTPGFPGAADLVRAAQAYGVKIVEGIEPPVEWGYYRWVIDGVFGTGFHGIFDTDSPLGRLWHQLGDDNRPVYALDILSGLDANSGACGVEPVDATKTLTFGAAKWGHFGYPGARHTGQLVVLDIGLPHLGKSSGRWLDPSWAKSQMPVRDFYAHKYRRGTVAVIGGSETMPGAPVLAGLAALKAGAGLVELFVPTQILHRIQAPAPLLVRGVENSAMMSAEDNDRLQRADVIIVGPGLGPGASPGILANLVKIGKPLVIDADGLRLLNTLALAKLPAGSVLTPHSGEMARMLGITAQAVDADRPRAVNRALDRFGAITVLKGAFSLIAGGRQIFINTANTPALATAGSGDVLAGIIAALLAGNASGDGVDTVALGTYLHGWAGIHSERRNGPSVIATDIIAAMGQSWQTISHEEPPPSLPVSL